MEAVIVWVWGVLPGPPGFPAAMTAAAAPAIVAITVSQLILR
jgi:hypothetical protein